MINLIGFRFHIGDFLNDGMQMDATEFGAYVLLFVTHLNEARSGNTGLEDDNERLARSAKVTPHVWKTRIKPNVLEKLFEKIDGRWVSKRAVDTWKNIQKNLSNLDDNPLNLEDAAEISDAPSLQPSIPFDDSNINHHPVPVSARETGSVPADRVGYRVQDWLTDEEKRIAESVARGNGWKGIEDLFARFNEDIAKGKREMPHNPQRPQKFFFGFCRVYKRKNRQ